MSYVGSLHLNRDHRSRATRAESPLLCGCSSKQTQCGRGALLVALFVFAWSTIAATAKDSSRAEPSSTRRTPQLWRANETAAYRPAADFEVVVIAPEQAFSPNEILHLNAEPDVLDSFRDVVRGEIAELNEQAGLEVGSADVAPIKDVQPPAQAFPSNSKTDVRVRSAQKWTVWTPFLVHGIEFSKLLSQDVITVEEVGTIYSDKLLGEVGDGRLRTRQLYDLPASRFAYKNVSLHFNLHAKETLRSEQKKEIQVLKDRIASLRSSYGRGYNLVPSRRAGREYDDWSSWFDRGAHDLRRWEFVEKWYCREGHFGGSSSTAPLGGSTSSTPASRSCDIDPLQLFRPQQTHQSDVENKGGLTFGGGGSAAADVDMETRVQRKHAMLRRYLDVFYDAGPDAESLRKNIRQIDLDIYTSHFFHDQRDEPKEPSSGAREVVEHEGLLSRFKDELFFRSQQTNKTHDLGYHITQVRSMHVFEQMLGAYVSAMDHVLARRRAHFEPFDECSSAEPRRNSDRKSSEAGIAVGAASASATPGVSSGAEAGEDRGAQHEEEAGRGDTTISTWEERIAHLSYSFQYTSTVIGNKLLQRETTRLYLYEVVKQMDWLRAVFLKAASESRRFPTTGFGYFRSLFGRDERSSTVREDVDADLLSHESCSAPRAEIETAIPTGASMGVSADTKMPLTQDADFESAPGSDDGRGTRSSSSITAAPEPDENERAYREAAHYGERPFLVRPPFSGDLVEAGVYLGGNAMLMAIASLPAFIFRKSAARYLNTFGKVAGPVLFKQKAYVEKEVEKFVDNALLGDEEESAGPSLEREGKKHLFEKNTKDVDEQEVYMQPRSVWLFDTFEGIPPPEGDKDDPEAVQNYLNRGGTSKPRPQKMQAAGEAGVVSVVQEVGAEQEEPAETAAAAVVSAVPPPAPSATPAVYNREPSQSTLDHSVASEESWLDSATGELRWNYGPYEVVRKHMQMTHFPMENVHLVRGKVEDTLSLHSRGRRGADQRGAETGSIPESISLLC